MVLILMDTFEDASKPAILTIDSGKAYNDGICFYKGNDKVILADNVPKEYIMIFSGS